MTHIPPDPTAISPARASARAQRPARGPGAGSILVIVLLAAAFFIRRGPMWNADSRIFLTASIVDRGQVNIDPFASQTGDLAQFGGHAYLDKAPGLSFAAVPVYVVVKYSLLRGAPYSSLFTVPPAQRQDFLPRYLLALVFAGLPTGLLSALLYSYLARLGIRRPWCTVLALSYGLGTIALPFASVFFGHQLAACLIFAAFILIYRVREAELRPRWAVAAGALAGYAVITEYPVAIIAAALVLYALLPPRAGWRAAALLGAGMLPAVILVAVYNTLAFGGPLSQGYAHLAGPAAFRVGQAQGFMGITWPHPEALWQTTVGPYRGLLRLSPLLALAVPGFWLLLQRREWRREALLWLAIVGAYFGFVLSYFEWDGGYSLGPRHFLPAVPFLVLPIGEVLRPQRARAWRIVAGALAAMSIVLVGLPTATGPLMDPRFDDPLTESVLPLLLGRTPDPAHPHLATEGQGTALMRDAPFFPHARLDNNWGLLFHLPGLLQVVPLVGGIALVLGWRVWRAHVAAVSAPRAGAARMDGEARAPAGHGNGQGGPVGWAARGAWPAARQEAPADVPAGVAERAGIIPVRQAEGGLSSVAPRLSRVRVALHPPAVAAPWEDAILDVARQNGDEPPLRVRHALAAVKLMLAQSKRLSFFRRIQTILLYGPLVRGQDPFREVNMLVYCRPLSGANVMERAFAELDQQARRLKEQTGVSVRCLLVVQGQPERAAPGEPSWRELATRGMTVYGEPLA